MEVKGDKAVVTVDRCGIIDVAVVDVTCVERCAKAQVKVPLPLPY